MKKVKKIWGEERIIINTKKYCGKILILKKGYRNSLQYHKKKDEALYILEGKVLFELGKKKRVMKLGDTQRVRPGQKHRYTGLENSKIIEFSTHHTDTGTYRVEMGGKVEGK